VFTLRQKNLNSLFPVSSLIRVDRRFISAICDKLLFFCLSFWAAELRFTHKLGLTFPLISSERNGEIKYLLALHSKQILVMEWPVDILAQLLGWLAWDGASVTFQHLAYLTINSSQLKQAARKVQRPLVLDIHIDESQRHRFIIPVAESQTLNVKIDWGDGNVEYVTHSKVKNSQVDPAMYIDHVYAAGDYVIRVFPADDIGPVWLDHLGFGKKYIAYSDIWWRPLRAVRSLGALGIRSLCGLFYGAEDFNLPLSHLDISNVTDLSYIFLYAVSFNQPIEKWNVSNVTNMASMFYGATKFNKPLDCWDVGKVEDMSHMFFSAISFNQPVSSWNVSHVKNMTAMFTSAASFNQPLGDWDVGHVRDMRFLFTGAGSFNQQLRFWNVSNVVDMRGMFQNALSFNQDLSSWDVSNVWDLSLMFCGAISFRQDLSMWNVSDATSVHAMFDRATSFDLRSVSGWKWPLSVLQPPAL
jgi:surface protein